MGERSVPSTEGEPTVLIPVGVLDSVYARGRGLGSGAARQEGVSCKRESVCVERECLGLSV